MPSRNDAYVGSGLIVLPSSIHASGRGTLVGHRAMVVGDSLTSDIAGGAAYGMRTCWYHPSWSDGDALPAGVDHAVGSLAEVRRVL